MKQENKSRILILLKHRENANLLKNYLEEFKEKYELVVSDDFDLPDDVFDLLILDGYALDCYFEKIRKKKEEHNPIFLPVLMVTTKKDINLVTRHLWKTVDELIFIPIRKVELLARVEILLRARRLSKESEYRYHALTEASPALIFILQNNRLVYGNSKFLELISEKRKKIEDIDFWDLVCSEHMSRFQDYVTQLLKGNKNGAIEINLCTKSGIRCFSLMGSCVEYRGIWSVLVVMWDITERKSLEASLKRSQEELTIRNIIAEMFLTYQDQRAFDHILKIILRYLDSSMGVIGYIDEKGNYVCPTLSKEVWDRCRMKDKDYIFPRDSWTGLWGRALKEKKACWTNEPLNVPSGHVPIENALDVPIVYGGELIGNIVVANKKGGYNDKDIALLQSIADYIAPILHARLEAKRERKNRQIIEEQFIQAQKMESIGRLAAGVAHDFNNILSVIIGYGELLLSNIPKDDLNRKKIEEILKAGERASTLTRQLLTFSRKHPMQPKEINLNVLINDLKKMLRRLIGEDISLELFLDENLANVLVDPGQMEQVILNLAVNARDAMPKGGRLVIETKNVELDYTYTKSHLSVKPGKYVLLSIADTGCGIPRDIIDKIFEPFFTTKERGKGTGLGLSTVYGIIKQSGGHIYVYSEEGKGTIFKIYLPESTRSYAHEVKELKDLLYALETKRILVVEDEDFVRELLEEVLTNLGYSVVAFSGGIEALNMMKNRCDNFDLVITDVIMPNMDGKEFVDRLKIFCPHIKVIYISGYTKDSLIHLGVFQDKDTFIQKPFNIYKLSEVVYNVLFK